MSSLINFKENLKDSMTNSLLDYLNYLHETKNNLDSLENGNDALAKCVVMSGELFTSKIKKGEASQDDIESFEALLLQEEMFTHKNLELNIANSMVKEGNAMALGEYESTFGAANKGIEIKKIA